MKRIACREFACGDGLEGQIGLLRLKVCRFLTMDGLSEA